MSEKLKSLLLRAINIFVKYPSDKTLNEYATVLKNKESEKEFGPNWNLPGQPFIGAEERGLCLLIFNTGRRDACFNDMTQTMCNNMAANFTEEGARPTPIIPGRRCQEYGMESEN